MCPEATHQLEMASSEASSAPDIPTIADRGFGQTKGQTAEQLSWSFVDDRYAKDVALRRNSLRGRSVCICWIDICTSHVSESDFVHVLIFRGSQCFPGVSWPRAVHQLQPADLPPPCPPIWMSPLCFSSDREQCANFQQHRSRPHISRCEPPLL